MSEEFIIKKEIGVGNIDKYFITPNKIVKNYFGYKYSVAKLYYTFTCSHLDNEPRLIMRIFPIYDISYIQNIFEIIFYIILIT